MPGNIAAVPTKLATFLIGATAYKFSRWSLTFTLETGEIRHFDADTDGNSNYWPTVISNFATGDGEASGAVDDSGDMIPIGAGLYIGSTGTATCLHMTGNGFMAPILITQNDNASDATSNDGAQRGIRFKMTGKPTRVFI
jgi:hypothetical protein